MVWKGHRNTFHDGVAIDGLACANRPDRLPGFSAGNGCRAEARVLSIDRHAPAA